MSLSKSGESSNAAGANMSSVYETAVHLLELKRAEHQKSIELINRQINEIWRRQVTDTAAGRVSPVPLPGDSRLQSTAPTAGAVQVQDRPEGGDTGDQCEGRGTQAMDRG